METPYYLASNVKANKLNEGSFSILHLNVRGLSKNIENIKHLIGSVNSNFSVTVFTE